MFSFRIKDIIQIPIKPTRIITMPVRESSVKESLVKEKSIKEIPVKEKSNIIIILRGHVRDSFSNDNIYKYILYLKNKYNLYIFIHTWNIRSGNISWRDVKKDIFIINKDIIINYFKNIDIKKIIIDDDSCIDLIGNTIGKIKTTLMPIKGWKYMWYGIHKITNYILNNMDEYKLDVNTYTLNIRLDYFSNNPTIKQYNNIDLMNNLYNFNSDNIQFLENKLYKDSMYGIDNIYFGKFYKIYYTGILFYTNLDYIIECFHDIYAQEKLVYYLQKYINIYCDDYLYDNDYINLTIKIILSKLKINYIRNINKEIENKIDPGISYIKVINQKI